MEAESQSQSQGCQNQDLVTIVETDEIKYRVQNRKVLHDIDKRVFELSIELKKKKEKRKGGCLYRGGWEHYSQKECPPKKIVNAKEAFDG